MQSTALVLQSCANARAAMSGMPLAFPQVPIYDAIIYCDLGIEPVWVPKQVKFIEAACKDCGIPFYVLRSNLYQDYMKNFGSNRVSAMPFWTINEDGKEGCIQRRACTGDYKIVMIQKFVRYQLLGYRPYQHLRPEDVGTHELHIGFSQEESQRSFPSRNRMFKNCYPLIEMGWERKDCYQYNLEEWGLDSKASACLICPYHKNYFFHYIQRNYPDDYASVVDFDEMLAKRQPGSELRNRVFLSRSRKRICELTSCDCDDAQTFEYRGRQLWNGF